MVKTWNITFSGGSFSDLENPTILIYCVDY